MIAALTLTIDSLADWIALLICVSFGTAVGRGIADWVKSNLFGEEPR